MGRTDARNQVIEGTVYSTGNEPFTRLALAEDGGERYLLHCPEAIEELLNSVQGRKVRIRYSGKQRRPEGMILTVVSAEVLPEQ